MDITDLPDDVLNIFVDIGDMFICKRFCDLTNGYYKKDQVMIFESDFIDVVFNKYTITSQRKVIHGKKKPIKINIKQEDINELVKNNNIAFLLYAFENNIYFRKYVEKYDAIRHAAAKHNNIRLFKLDLGIKPKFQTILAAIEHDNVAIPKTIYARYACEISKCFYGFDCAKMVEMIYFAAIVHSSFDVFKWVIYRYKHNAQNVLILLIMSNSDKNIILLQWYINNFHCDKQNQYFCGLAAKGSLQFLKLLHTNGFCLPKEVAYYADMYSKHDCYDYAVQNGCAPEKSRIVYYNSSHGIREAENKLNHHIKHRVIKK